MNAKEARHALASDISLSLGPAWTVYPGPPEGVNAPAVVIAPASPYRVKSTVCNEEVRLRVTVLVQRAASSDGLDVLDDACTAVRSAIHASEVMSVVDSVSDIGLMQEVGGVTFLAANLSVTSQV